MMWRSLWNLVTAPLYSLGLWRKEVKLLLLGLDNAGKTTLLHQLVYQQAVAAPPTLHPTNQTLVCGRVTITFVDLGGHKQARRTWQTYCYRTDAVVFLLDAADRDRLDEAHTELHHLLTMAQLVGCPFLILGNKIDKGAAVSEAELLTLLQLHNYRDHNIRLQMCSVVKRTGYSQGLQWLEQILAG
jgi:GTP-binding protein SAR1